MTTTPSKPDLVALADWLSGLAKPDSNIGVHLEAKERATIVSALRHLASQPSLYEAGLRDMRERAAKVASERIAGWDNLTNAQKMALRWWPDGDEIAAAIAALPADGGEDKNNLPADVVRLVIAARIVAFEDQGPEAIKELDEASEAFADRVGWDDEPMEDTENVDLSSADRNTAVFPVPVRRSESVDLPQSVVSTPSTAGSVREALDWPKIEHPHRPDEASYEKIQLKEKLKKFGPEIVAQTILNYALSLPKQGSFAGSLWAIAEWLTAALSPPVEAPVAVKPEYLALADQYDAGTEKCRASGYEEFGDKFFRERKMVSAALRAYATPRPLPSVDDLAMKPLEGREQRREEIYKAAEDASSAMDDMRDPEVAAALRAEEVWRDDM